MPHYFRVFQLCCKRETLNKYLVFIEGHWEHGKASESRKKIVRAIFHQEWLWRVLPYTKISFLYILSFRKDRNLSLYSVFHLNENCHFSQFLKRNVLAKLLDSFFS